eukprot:m51a1_g9068 hypothetical protein (1084) ;mRNA; r:102673-106245
MGPAIVIDVEGTGQEDLCHDVVVTSPAIAVSDVVLAVMRGAAQRQAVLDYLCSLVDVLARLDLGPPEGRPDLLFVCKDAPSTTDDELRAWVFDDEPAAAATARNTQRARVRCCFRRLGAVAVPSPSGAGASFDGSLLSGCAAYRQRMAELCSLVRQLLAAPRTGARSAMDGHGLASALREVATRVAAEGDSFVPMGELLSRNACSAALRRARRALARREAWHRALGRPDLSPGDLERLARDLCADLARSLAAGDPLRESAASEFQAAVGEARQRLRLQARPPANGAPRVAVCPVRNPVSRFLDGGTVVIEGQFPELVLRSSCVDPTKNTRVRADRIVIADVLRAPGRSIELVCRVLVARSDDSCPVGVDVSGLCGLSHSAPSAPGVPGTPGGDGGHGGSILIACARLECAVPLVLSANGGAGGIGQQGHAGQDGTDGVQYPVDTLYYPWRDSGHEATLLLGWAGQSFLAVLEVTATPQQLRDLLGLGYAELTLALARLHHTNGQLPEAAAMLVYLAWLCGGGDSGDPRYTRIAGQCQALLECIALGLGPDGQHSDWVPLGAEGAYAARLESALRCVAVIETERLVLGGEAVRLERWSAGIQAALGDRSTRLGCIDNALERERACLSVSQDRLEQLAALQAGLWPVIQEACRAHAERVRGWHQQAAEAERRSRRSGFFDILPRIAPLATAAFSLVAGGAAAVVCLATAVREAPGVAAGLAGDFVRSVAPADASAAVAGLSCGARAVVRLAEGAAEPCRQLSQLVAEIDAHSSGNDGRRAEIAMPSSSAGVLLADACAAWEDDAGRDAALRYVQAQAERAQLRQAVEGCARAVRVLEEQRQQIVETDVAMYTSRTGRELADELSYLTALVREGNAVLRPMVDTVARAVNYKSLVCPGPIEYGSLSLSSVAAAYSGLCPARAAGFEADARPRQKKVVTALVAGRDCDQQPCVVPATAAAAPGQLELSALVSPFDPAFGGMALVEVLSVQVVVAGQPPPVAVRQLVHTGDLVRKVDREGRVFAFRHAPVRVDVPEGGGPVDLTAPGFSGLSPFASWSLLLSSSGNDNMVQTSLPEISLRFNVSYLAV